MKDKEKWGFICLAMVYLHFADLRKAKRWMGTQNPLLGGVSPNDMVEIGRHEKLFRFIRNQLSENREVGK